MNSVQFNKVQSLPPLVLVPFPLHLGQHVVQSSDLRCDGVDLDPDAVRVPPGGPGPRLPADAEAAGVVEGPDGSGEEARRRRQTAAGGVLFVDVAQGFGRVVRTRSGTEGETHWGEVGVWICVQVVWKERRGVQGGREEAAWEVGRITDIMERDVVRSGRNWSDKSSLDPRVFGQGFMKPLSAAAVFHGLLQLFLQHFIPALQFVDFG